MRHLEIRIEPQSPEAAQAPRQLDVLDLRPRVALRVEAAGAQEGVASHGPAAAPEARRLAARSLMGVVVTQIHVEREEVALGRSRVVGAAQRYEIGLRAEGAEHPRDRVGVEHAVGVHEEHELGLDGRDAGVARPSRPLALGQPHDAGTELARERAGFVRRARVDDDDGHVRPGRAQRRE